ncbi:MAG TPA: LLM class F420-dependent oxidoreductase, partial [Ktedonobacter sp.]|nr:LLM class F420-dependent oxidoreductase [Ktedonobacter sp.]HCF88176.1 LLM class F420-dependent oxidoreductase [Ktedonobacter sp.]
IGIDQGIFSLQNVTDPEVFDILATDVIPQVDRIVVAGR